MMHVINSKKALVIMIMLAIAACFVIGADWAGATARRLYHSYFADVAIPFGYYFLLVLVEDIFGIFKKWFVKATAIFALCALSETLQYFGVYALASVFDVWDFFMYAAGVLLAAFVDRLVLKKMLGFWD